jgi:mRNA-degrading endonuclease RelE of RelBE toxin-antitoxin system
MPKYTVLITKTVQKQLKKLPDETCIQQPSQQGHDYSMQVPYSQIIK